ncbi:hypothetical protein [Streptomyces sp. CBMA152]|uniref:hypothetical protein n=1 Tax=Streptomyces sp. CBMA152 TaxID=1896312 RepID=UPI001660C344|nr:hypothetical protein [Streptomyces sp. CBMA152]MBD0748028.1 hypothetical protein [Streptomyces sp. CBMA152]
MALQVPQPPQESRSAAEAGVELLAGLGRVRPAQTLVPAGADELQLAHPLQMYVIGLADLPGGLAGARPVAWRYLVQHSSGPVALAETVRDEAGGHVFSQLNYGPFVAGTAAALDAADRESGDAEVRLLHLPAVHLIAVWLHGEASDTLIPAAPAPPGVEADHAYPATELFTLLARDAPQDILPPEAGDDRGGG